MKRKPTIYLLFLNPSDTKYVLKHLSKTDFSVESIDANNIDWEVCKNADLLIVQDELAFQYGEELRALKEKEQYIYLPIVVAISLSVDMSDTKWYRCNLDDLIRLPISKAELISRIEVLLRLRFQTIELKYFADMGKSLSAAKTPREAALIVLNVAEKLYGWDAAYIHFYLKEVNRLYPIIYIDTIDGKKKEFRQKERDENLLKIIKETLKDGPRLILRHKDENNPELVPFGNVGKKSNSLMFVPIKKGKQNTGFLSIQSYKENAYTNKDLDSLQILASHCSEALERTFAEFELHKSEEHLKMLASQMPALLWSTNSDLIITSFYGTGLEQIKHKKIIGFSIQQAFSIEDNNTKLTDIHKRALNGNSSIDEIEILNRYFQIFIKPMTDSDNNISGCIGVALDITTRKKAEEELKQIHKIYHDAIVKTKGVPYYLNYSDLQYKFIGAECESIFGLKPEEINRENFRKIIKEVVITDPEAPINLREYINAFRDGKVNSYQVDLKILTPQGEIKWVCDSSVPILDEKTGEVTGSLGILTDITERKLSEERAKKSAEKKIKLQSALLELSKLTTSDLSASLKKITEISADAMQVDRIGIWFFNDEMTELICKDMFILSKKSHEVAEIIKASDYPNYFNEVKKSRLVATSDAKNDFRTKEFSDSYLKLNNISSMMDVPIRMHGKMIGILCHEHVGDIREWLIEEQDFATSVADYISLTIEFFERKRAEEELRKTASELSAIFQALPDLYFRFDPNGIILDSKASDKLGYYIPPEQFLNKRVQDVLPPDIGEKVVSAIKNVLKTNSLEVIEYVLTTLEGENSYEARLLPLMDNQVIGIVRNISERKQAEMERQVLTRLAIRLAAVNSIDNIKKVVSEECEILLDWDAHFFAVMIPKTDKFLVVSLIDTIDGKKIEFPNKEWNISDLQTIYLELFKGNPVIINRDPAQKHRELTRFGDTKKESASLMFVPIRSGKNVIGVISCQSYKVGKYNENHLHLFQRVADIVAPSLERANAEDALRESEARYRAIIEDQTELICRTSSDGTVEFVNEAYCKYYNLDRGDLIGKKVQPNNPYETSNTITYKIKLLDENTPFITFEYRTVLPDKSIHWLQWTVRAIFTNKKIIKNLQWVGIDITERKNAEEKIHSALKEKEMLLKEIHHRVKNNLQIISSLLNLQTKYYKDERIIDILKESQNRVRTMAIIHEKLYQSKDLAQINFGDYVNNLTSNLLRSYGRANNVSIIINAENIFLGIDTAIPFGLIINELVTNSLKYAFLDNNFGKIEIDIYYKDDFLNLIVKDNGVGFPEHLNFRNTETLGLQLVCMLIDQLEADIQLIKGKGTEFKIILPLNN